MPWEPLGVPNFQWTLYSLTNKHQLVAALDAIGWAGLVNSTKTAPQVLLTAFGTGTLPLASWNCRTKGGEVFIDSGNGHHRIGHITCCNTRMLYRIASIVKCMREMLVCRKTRGKCFRKAL